MMTAKWQYKQAYEGVLEEVRSLKAENAKLRACLGDGCADCAIGMGEYADSLCDPLKTENEKLKKRLAQYELFREVVGDLASEFASLRRELHRVERENEKLRKILQEGVSDQLSTCGCCWGGPCEDCDCWVTERADELRDLGIKVSYEHE